MNSRVLVTGGAGFIGSHLVQHLLNQGQTVRVLERPGVSVDHLPREDVEVVFADIREPLSLEKHLKGCEFVLHLAANPNLWARDSRIFEQVNHQGTKHVLAAARKHDVAHVVHVSTESILAPKNSQEVITEETQTELSEMIGPYCRSKWLAEQAARDAAKSGQPVVIVSPTVPVGPGDLNRGPLSRMICDFCHGRVKGYLEGDLNIIDVRDVARGIWSAAQKGQVGHRYLLSNENYSILEFLRMLARLTGREAPRFRVPYVVALSFAHAEEWVSRFLSRRIPMATVTGIKLTQRPFQFDGRRSATELGLLPYRDCRSSVEETLHWFRGRGLIPA